MKISIIVPAYNEEKLLPQSLPGIQSASAAFHALGWETELIVCDNNSSDRTAEVARGLGATVVFEPINQIARARNKGAEKATGDWMVFIDADSFPTAGLFRRVAEEIGRPRTIGGGCLLKMDEDLAIANFMVALWNTVSRITKWAAGSFIYCEANAFRAVGGFNTALFVTEELDFCRRLKRHARAKSKRLVIITDVRMMTSARKMHLYKKGEHLRFFFKAIFRPRKVFADPAECHVWYDGRR